MSDQVRGRNVIVEKEVSGTYYAIGCGIDCEFNFQNEFVGKTVRNAGSGSFIKRRVRMSDCSGSVNGVTKTSNATTLSVFHFLLEGVRRTEANYRFRFIADDATEQVLTMTGIVESTRITGNVSDYSLFDLSILSTGGFTMTDVPPPGVAIIENWFADYWTTVQGDYWIGGATPSARFAYTLNGKTLLHVGRESFQYDIIATGTPAGRQCKWNSTLSRLEFDPALPFAPGETVNILFKTV